jgi:FkbM family methyltransferase
VPRSTDLHFNRFARFTRWVVRNGALQRPFVVVDVGVFGGESPRWHLLGDHLVVHGLDPIEEAVDGLRQASAGKPNRHYHHLAAGNTDEERVFYVDEADPFSSSFYGHGDDRLRARTAGRSHDRKVQVRRLDSLLAEGILPPFDFLKCDVEGFEREVFAGAAQALTAVLGVETETSFSISPGYPKTHFGTLQELLIDGGLLPFDLSFDRVPRTAFVEAVAQRRGISARRLRGLGKPGTLNVLFCRDPIGEADHPEHYRAPCPPVDLDQLIKLMVIYELHGLNDIALDTAVRFSEQLAGRLDVDKAIDLLADPKCRSWSGIRPLHMLPQRALRKARWHLRSRKLGGRTSPGHA